MISMMLICGFVWGGFSLLLSYAIRKEKEKAEEGRTR
jgi:hypothetical protein